MSTISVVIPSIGRPTLERALSSATQQLPRPSEVIVIFNAREPLEGSRVSHLEFLAGDIPLKVSRLPPLSGPSISRNLGAWQATGEYVAFLDDDDEYGLGYFEAMGRAIADHHPDVLYAAKLWRDSAGQVVRELRLSATPPTLWLDKSFRHENIGFGGTNLVVRREAFFELGGFPVELPSGEDRAFAMSALVSGLQVLYVDEAHVECHPPSGVRARHYADKWFTNLKLTRAFWNEVPWKTRMRSLWRLLRQFFDI